MSQEEVFEILKKLDKCKEEGNRRYGYNIEEIIQMTGISEKNVRVNISKLLKNKEIKKVEVVENRYYIK